MLEHILLENFKASRHVPARLAPLTVLTGLNSSGKSTLLQALGVLRQSYDAKGSTNGLSLSGQLVQLGKYGDLLTEGTESDVVSVTVVENGKEYQWVFGGSVDANEVPFSKVPEPEADFVTTPNFQFLQADRIVPRTLYPQAPQMARATGFLGPRGEYTIDFLYSAADRTVPKQRSFPRTGIGIREELLNKVAPTDGLLDQVVGWLQQLSPGSRLISDPVVGTDEVLLKYRYDGRIREVSTNFYRATNVGFGLTYSLPILVGCLAAPKGALILMENPEAHLHPQGQSALGELVARCASDGVQIIVETHSDHLLNGVRLSVKRRIIDKGSIALHFFSRSVETGEASVETPAIMDNGRLSNWPSGFFDQWDKDVEAFADSEGSRSEFRADSDHHSELIPITVPG